MSRKFMPILRDHDQRQVIGKATAKGGRLAFRFYPGHEPTQDELFQVFGGAGLVVREQKTDGDSVTRTIAGEVIEFSLLSKSNQMDLAKIPCQESSIHSTAELDVPCGEPGAMVVFHQRDGRNVYVMCEACGTHNVRNRRGIELVAKGT